MVDSKFSLNGEEFDSDFLTLEQQKVLIKLLFCKNKVRFLNAEMEKLSNEAKEIENDLERYVLINFS